VKFNLDENLPVELEEDFRNLGYDACGFPTFSKLNWQVV
jgi:hypothetical protein